MAKAILTAESVRQMFSYDEVTGKLTWKQKSPRAGIGAEAGYNNGKYLVVGFNKTTHKVHRIIWLHFYGEHPLGVIDHIDGEKTNNAIRNLRDVSPSENSQNIKTASKNNKSGLLGVCWHKRDKKWIAQIRLPESKYALEIGRFDSPEDAHKAYIDKKREVHEGCTL